MGLVLLSLLLTFVASAWSGGAAPWPAKEAGPIWSAGTDDALLSTLPPQPSTGREHHVLALWPPLRGERHSQTRLPLLPSPGTDAERIRDPQQPAHRASGSRSPPSR